MWGGMKTALMLGGLAIFLATAPGCTVSIQPWTRPIHVDTSQGSPAPAGFQGPMPKPLPPNGPAGNEAFSQLIQKYNEADEHRRALQEQVSALKKDLKDRETQMTRALYEVEESTNKLKTTRTEFRQWEAEMNELRERVRKLEDNRRVLGQMIEEIMNHLDHPREPTRNPMGNRLK